MTLKDELIALIRERSFQYSPEPTFKLASGAMSNFYFNLKKATYSPRGLYLIGRLGFEKIKEAGLSIKALGGLTMGADPVSAAVARHSFDMREPIEAFVVRKEPKQYGMGLQVEGYVQPGDTVVIVDDVITTGGSTIKAINAAKAYGLDIKGVLVVVDRCEQNGRQNIEALGYPVHSLLTVNDFIPGRP